MLTPDERRVVLTTVRSSDSMLADKLALALDERENAIVVAKAVALQQETTKVLDRFGDLWERQIKLDEKREARWDAVLGKQGLVAAVIAGAIAVATAAIPTILGQDEAPPGIAPPAALGYGGTP